MDEKISKQSIYRLDISDDAINILNENKIKTIGQLCKKTKKDLKNYDLLQNDIKKIEIELQLIGLDIRDNV